MLSTSVSNFLCAKNCCSEIKNAGSAAGISGRIRAGVNALIFLLFIAFVVSACNTKQSPAATDRPGWKLVWQDEFNYTGLPDADKWDYETGHIANNEQQYYTRARKENVWVENGLLTITAREEEYPNARYSPGSSHWTTRNPTAPYTSARLITLGKASWLYGRVEIKAKLPAGKGVWPALWMMGTDIKSVGWPACGEIDIMEFIGDKDPTTIYGTIHYKNDAGKHASKEGKTKVDKPLNDFNIYAVEWDSDKIDVYFNDIKYQTFNINEADISHGTFHKPFYLLMNLALGGDWAGPVDASILPQQYVIDYVRVYQKK